MEATRVRQPAAVPASFGLGVVVLGAVLGAVAPPVANWLVTLLHRTPLPVHGLIDVAADLPLSWSLPIGLILGVVGGLGIASAILRESLTLTIDADGVEYRQNGRDGWLDHTAVASFYRDGRYAVVLDHHDGILARLDADGIGTSRLQGALEQHGYRFRTSDPFESEYRRWQDGRPEFTAAEHRILRRWHEAGKNSLERIEAEADLREAHLAVREREGRLQVRRTTGSKHGTYRRPAAS